MGLDLAVMPMRFKDMDWWLCTERLSCDRQHELFESIQMLPAKPIPAKKSVQVYDDDGIREVKTDPYGSPLTYLTAGEMSKARLPKGLTDWNKGIMAFVKSIPSDTPVILWWH